LTRKTDRKGQTITYVYDALNRLTHKSYPDSTGVDYVYDLVGKIQQVNDPNSGAECSLRRVAVRRKNWLFFGRDNGGRRPRLAVSSPRETGSISIRTLIFGMSPKILLLSEDRDRDTLGFCSGETRNSLRDTRKAARRGSVTKM
jgi:YD repeat-containing protein